MMGKGRNLRVAETLRRELSLIIQNEIKDPRVGSVTITRVDLSPDLKNAKVFLSTLDETEKMEEELKVLNRATGYIRSILGKRIVLKTVPRIDFKVDKSIDFNIRMDEILREVKEKEQEDGKD